MGSSITIEAPSVRIMRDVLDSYLNFILKHPPLSDHNRIMAFAVGRMRLRLKIDPNGQEDFEDAVLEPEEIEDLKKALAAFIASAQDIFCPDRNNVIASLSQIIVALS